MFTTPPTNSIEAACDIVGADAPVRPPSIARLPYADGRLLAAPTNSIETPCDLVGRGALTPPWTVEHRPLPPPKGEVSPPTAVTEGAAIGVLSYVDGRADVGIGPYKFSRKSPAML